MITTENASSWLVDSLTVQGFSPHGGKWAGSDPNEKLQLQPGDVVWIGKQPTPPEVGATLLPFVSLAGLLTFLHIRVDLQRLGGKGFAWLSWLSRVVG